MTDEKVPVSTKYIKLDSLLKLCGVCATGGQSKLMIEQGKVSVNGERCLMRGKKLVPGCIVEISGQDVRYEVTSGEG